MMTIRQLTLLLVCLLFLYTIFLYIYVLYAPQTPFFQFLFNIIINSLYFPCFFYFLSFQSKEKMMKGVRRGCVRLKDAVIGIDDQEDNTFTITVDHKTFHFQVSDLKQSILSIYILKIYNLKQIIRRLRLKKKETGALTYERGFRFDRTQNL